MSQLNLLYGTNNLPKSGKKTGKLRSIVKQSGESVESALKKKRKAAVGRIWRKGRFKPGMKE